MALTVIAIAASCLVHLVNIVSLARIRPLKCQETCFGVEERDALHNASTLHHVTTQHMHSTLKLFVPLCSSVHASFRTEGQSWLFIHYHEATVLECNVSSSALSFSFFLWHCFFLLHTDTADLCVQNILLKEKLENGTHSAAKFALAKITYFCSSIF